MPYATYRFNKIIAAETIRFIVTVAIVVYKGLKLVVYRMLTLPLPDMYGKNLTFKTGGVDGCDCAEILNLIEEGKIDTTPLITHKFPLNEIEEAYRIFENRLDGVIKVAIEGNS